MTDAPPVQDADSDPANELQFCKECMTSLKQQTTWCSRPCATSNFPQHHEQIHLPERKKLGLSGGVSDEAVEEVSPSLSSGDGEGGSGRGRRYRVKDMSAAVVSYEEAAREWEGKYRVQLGQK